MTIKERKDTVILKLKRIVFAIDHVIETIPYYQTQDIVDYYNKKACSDGIPLIPYIAKYVDILESLGIVKKVSKYSFELSINIVKYKLLVSPMDASEIIDKAYADDIEKDKNILKREEKRQEFFDSFEVE